MGSKTISMHRVQVDCERCSNILSLWGGMEIWLGSEGFVVTDWSHEVVRAVEIARNVVSNQA